MTSQPSLHLADVDRTPWDFRNGKVDGRGEQMATDGKSVEGKANKVMFIKHFPRQE